MGGYKSIRSKDDNLLPHDGMRVTTALPVLTEVVGCWLHGVCVCTLWRTAPTEVTFTPSRKIIFV